jgi:bifunctional DNA-binding transcriptional regulator/antitoxin component of YhaV-PrlF toxin-antitoxin module
MTQVFEVEVTDNTALYMPPEICRVLGVRSGDLIRWIVRDTHCSIEVVRRDHESLMDLVGVIDGGSSNAVDDHDEMGID